MEEKEKIEIKPRGQIKELQKVCHEIALDKGFYEGYNKDYLPNAVSGNRPLSELIALMHSELSEALEGARQTDPEKQNVGEEFADTVIRILDACEYMGINLEFEIYKKIEKNKARAYKHGKKF